jgi:hypothetical protein
MNDNTQVAVTTTDEQKECAVCHAAKSNSDLNLDLRESVCVCGGCLAE